jgi:ribosomal protein S18 acetylase RimI-like enzyme
MKIKKVLEQKELDILTDKSADFGELHFVFSEEYLSRLKNWLDDGFQFFALEDDKFAGYIAAIKSEKDKNSLQIVELFVDPAYQGKSFGTKLVEKMIALAKENNFFGIIVQTEKENIPAQKLYEKLGFEEIKILDWSDGITYRYII